jgi:malate dehydrogenase (oxaloacetate-decarboxylating)
MAAGAPRPIIFPLSNPTTRMEAAPADLLAWTGGNAIVATGSPIAPVAYGSRTYPIAQCNNAYIFPAIGLAVRACGARRVSEGMMRAAARSLGAQSPALADPEAPLLPPLSEVRSVARKIALAIALEAVRQGHADAISEDALAARVDELFWGPAYPA